MTKENKALIKKAEAALRSAHRNIGQAWRITEEAKLVMARARKSDSPRTK